jgi:glucose-6-phosphate 1-dehydrogenase
VKHQVRFSDNDDDNNDTNERQGKAKFSIVIFGASGDLASRKIVPALYSLNSQKLLPRNFDIIGVGRSEFSDEKFRAKLKKGVQKYARINPRNSRQWNDFSKHLTYLKGNYDDPETFNQIKEKLLSSEKEDHHSSKKKNSRQEKKNNVLFYASTPPSIFPEIVEQLYKAGFGGTSGSSSEKKNSEIGKTNIIIEKPFGRDLKSARSLNLKVHSAFKENQVYRIDHYLGKETVQNILTFRFANSIFEPLWTRNYIDHVQITVAESVGVEHRAGYYDQAGVARDMLQNHLLQLVSLCAMDPPSAFNEKELRDEKLKVLNSIEPLTSSEDCVWGQYAGYRKEEGIKRNSRTPTYIALKLYVNNWRWQGVPFFLRTGKKLREKVSEIVVQFKRVPLLLFPKDTDVRPNRISICIQPDEGLHLRFETKEPGMGMRTTPVNMVFHYSRFGEKALPEAYEHLILDALHGDPSLFARSDAIEKAWTFVDPIVESIENGESELFSYRPGSWGPKEADDLMKRESRSWYIDCINEEKMGS